jgi:hypothetical protein
MPRKADPLLAAPKPKKDPLKVSSSTSVDLFAEVSLAKQKFDSDRQTSTSSALARGARPTKVRLSLQRIALMRNPYGVARIKVLIYGRQGT